MQTNLFGEQTTKVNLESLLEENPKARHDIPVFIEKYLEKRLPFYHTLNRVSQQELIESVRDLFSSDRDRRKLNVDDEEAKR